MVFPGARHTLRHGLAAATVLLAAPAALAAPGVARARSSRTRPPYTCPRNHCQQLWYRVSVRHEYEMKVKARYDSPGHYLDWQTESTAQDSWHGVGDTPVLVHASQPYWNHADHVWVTGFRIDHGEIIGKVDQWTGHDVIHDVGYRPDGGPGGQPLSFDCTRTLERTMTMPAPFAFTFRFVAPPIPAVDDNNYGPGAVWFSYTEQSPSLSCPISDPKLEPAGRPPANPGDPFEYLAVTEPLRALSDVDQQWYYVYQSAATSGELAPGEDVLPPKTDLHGKVGDPNISFAMLILIRPHEASLPGDPRLYHSQGGYWKMNIDLTRCPRHGRRIRGC